nr:Ycf86 [Erythrotrichia welwitschii]
MSIHLGQTVIIERLITTNSSKINLKLGQKGLIRGLKLTSQNLRLLMVEFKDHTRVWFLEQEVRPI